MKLFFTRLLVCCAAALALPNCHEKLPQPEPVVPTCTTAATVRDLTGLDGCGKVLVLNNGQRLQPVGNVWQAFRATEGQKVLMDYKASPNAVNTCTVGQVVELTCIRELVTVPPTTPMGN